MTEDSGETDSSGSDMPFVRKRRSKSRDRPRLEGLSYKDSKIPGTIILFNRLVEENEEDSEPFAEPVDPVAENVPDYHQVIKRPMDLRTLKENLGKGLYTTVKDFESDFELMIENSIRFNGLTHSVSQGGLRLFEAFKVLMASSRGCK